jgi:hypothetical protein
LEEEHFRYEVGGKNMLKEQPKVQKCRVTLAQESSIEKKIKVNEAAAEPPSVQ